MMKVRVEHKKFHHPIKGIIDGADGAIKETLALLETTTKAYAPVDTGFLRGGIFTRIARRVGYMISPARYSIYQENTANGGAGYIKPAVAFVRTRVTGIFGKNLRSAMRRS